MLSLTATFGMICLLPLSFFLLPNSSFLLAVSPFATLTVYVFVLCTLFAWSAFRQLRTWKIFAYRFAAVMLGRPFIIMSMTVLRILVCMHSVIPFLFCCLSFKSLSLPLLLFFFFYVIGTFEEIQRYLQTDFKSHLEVADVRECVLVPDRSMRCESREHLLSFVAELSQKNSSSAVPCMSVSLCLSVCWLVCVGSVLVADSFLFLTDSW